jgi:hypothetical protein
MVFVVTRRSWLRAPVVPWLPEIKDMNIGMDECFFTKCLLNRGQNHLVLLLWLVLARFRTCTAKSLKRLNLVWLIYNEWFLDMNKKLSTEHKIINVIWISVNTFISRWSAVWYIDDVLSMNNRNFQNYVHLIYPDELEIKDTTESRKSASYLDILFNIDSNGRLTTSLYIYDKRDDFDFAIINFPF